MRGKAVLRLHLPLDTLTLALQMKRPATEYFARNIWINADPEEKMFPLIVQFAGDEKFFVGSDYPHAVRDRSGGFFTTHEHAKEGQAMLGAVAHTGITVRDMEKALHFYRDLLGLKVLGDITITGAEVDTITRVQGAELRAMYLRSEEDPKGPPIELLQFVKPAGETGTPYPRLTNPGITEVAFWVKDIEKTYAELHARGVEFYSAPQLFELEGYGKVKAVYFWDPDGTTLELLQSV